MMGQTQPAKDQTHTTWIGDGKMRMDQGQTSTVVDLGGKISAGYMTDYIRLYGKHKRSS